MIFLHFTFKKALVIFKTKDIIAFKAKKLYHTAIEFLYYKY